MYKELPKAKTLNQLFAYTPSTGELTWKNPLSRKCKPGGRAGYIDKVKGYAVVGINGTRYRAHRVIWKMSHGRLPRTKQIDHVDGNKANNRLRNLRLVTNLENCRNMAVSKNNTSGYCGVRWDKQKQAWRAQIMLNGKNQHLVLSKDKNIAIAARRNAEQQHNFCVRYTS